MTRPVDPLKMGDAIKLYLSGKTIEQAATAIGISATPLARELRKQGLSRSRRIDLADAVASYAAGEAVLAIAKRHGVSRDVVSRHLVEAGVQMRSVAEQGRLAAARQTAEERRERAAAAHAAVRGKPRSQEALRRSALTHEAAGRTQSGGERRMLGWLQERGYEPRVQVAVGTYNIDMTIASVAVEVLGGEWHGYKTTHAQRTKEILDAGWHVLFAWDTTNFPITSGAADYAVAFAEEACGEPAAVREYRVIRGDGEFVAGGRADAYDLTLIPPARHGCDIYEVSARGLAARWGRD